MAHPFLSDDWIAAARQIRAEYEGKAPAPAHEVRMNLVITEVPFEPPTVHAHLDTSSGEVILELDHLEIVDLTVTVDYVTARAIFIDQDPNAGMQAFMSGKVRVEGDITKLMAMQAQAAQAVPLALEIAERIKAITA